MTTQLQTEMHALSISAETERVLHDFVRDAVSHLSEALKDSVPDFVDDTRFEHGTDGHFRERKNRMRKLWPMLSDEWLRSLPDYQIVRRVPEIRCGCRTASGLLGRYERVSLSP